MSCRFMPTEHTSFCFFIFREASPVMDIPPFKETYSSPLICIKAIAA